MLAGGLGVIGPGRGIAHRDSEPPLHCRGASQQLAPDADHRLRGKVSGVRAQQAADDRGLAPGTKRARLAGDRHALDHTRALHQQVVQPVVDTVEFGTQR
jgi:hypothetical protein